VKPWTVVGRARTPDGTELTLVSHATEYMIQAGGQTLMSSRVHGSEDALAVLGCRHARTVERPRVLVGGLGMGFTLRAALDILPASADVLVVELLSEVVDWNRGPLGALTAYPLDDPRVRVEIRDAAVTLRSSPGQFDAVLLDIDNGPAALTTSANNRLYEAAGLRRVLASLKPEGVLALWSARTDRAFERRLRAAGASVKEESVRGRIKSRGPRHSLLIATLRSTRRDEPGFQPAH
jgi:spermidine synthase